MLVIAHRGASKYAPENTISAFKKAVELGVDGVELDVQMTSDNVPMVAHSDRLTEFTTTYTFIHATPLRAIKTIDIGSHFGPAFAGERIPTLEEVLELFARLRNAECGVRSDKSTIHNCQSEIRNPLINLELKAQPYWHFGLEERTVELVRKFGLGDQVVFSSFSPLVLWRLKRAAPEIRRALLIEPRAFFFLRIRFFGKVLGISNLHPFHEPMTQKLLDRARSAGWKVISWTVNSREDLERAVAMGVDGVITDDPVLARDVVSSHAL